jgi:hypothetical protein
LFVAFPLPTLLTQRLSWTDPILTLCLFSSTFPRDTPLVTTAGKRQARFEGGESDEELDEFGLGGAAGDEPAGTAADEQGKEEQEETYEMNAEV